MCVILVIISNNVFGIDFSLGFDIVVNVVMESCDCIKQFVLGIKCCVFIVEIMGGYCGYLVIVIGIVVGVDVVYVFEDFFNIYDLKVNVEYMMEKMKIDIQRGLVLWNEKCYDYYIMEFLYNLYLLEGKGVFDCRINVLGYLQQGGVLIFFDWNYGIKLGVKVMLWLLEKLCEVYCKGWVFVNVLDLVCVIGLKKKVVVFSFVIEFKKDIDFEYCMLWEQWWLSLWFMLKMLV